LSLQRQLRKPSPRDTASFFCRFSFLFFRRHRGTPRHFFTSHVFSFIRASIDYALALQRDIHHYLSSRHSSWSCRHPHSFLTSPSSLSYYNLVIVFTTSSSLDAISFIPRTPPAAAPAVVRASQPHHHPPCPHHHSHLLDLTAVPAPPRPLMSSSTLTTPSSCHPYTFPTSSSFMSRPCQHNLTCHCLCLSNLAIIFPTMPSLTVSLFSSRTLHCDLACHAFQPCC
jgi:hypothetical protein